MKTLSKTAVSALALTMTLGLVGGAAAQEFSARIGHLERAEQARHQGLEMVAEIVRERTDGNVVFELFPAGQLGQAREMNEGVQLGVIEGTVSPAAFLSGFNPAVSILDVPFIYPADREAANELRTGAFGEAVLASFDEIGVNAIAIWPNGRKSFTSNKPLDSVEDFVGQHFRVMDSRVLISQFEAVGASAIALPFGELYTALQTGVVDGQENALDTISSMRYDEVQTNLLVSEHGANEDIVMFNPDWWNSLPEEYQTIIVEAFDEVRPKVEEIKEASQAASRERLEEAGMNIRDITDEERDMLREMMYPQARDTYVAETGAVANAIVEVYEAEYERIVE
jgi:tripartite ATP-independent transporter DctP family solute receptor